MNNSISFRRASNVALSSDTTVPQRRESIYGDNQMVTRRGSVKRGSIVEDEEALEAKRLKAALEAMGMMKKKQKEFTWDSVKKEKDEPEETKTRKVSLSSQRGSNNDQMSKETAMKILKLDRTVGKVTKPKNITDYSEDDILSAFQAECKYLSKIKQYLQFNL